MAATVAAADLFRLGADDARRTLADGRRRFQALFDRVELLALPTLPIFPPRLDSITPDSLLPTIVEITKHVAGFNAAGVPCSAQPVPRAGGRVPASLELVRPRGGEELLLATAARVEAAVRP